METGDLDLCSLGCQQATVGWELFNQENDPYVHSYKSRECCGEQHSWELALLLGGIPRFLFFR